ncbi:Pex25p Ecym_7098 [Eremothecium cymbalariae DBVPG|uniref:Peroxisomal membrane protein PEX25 n=1 Tax=Eremothecium cymbalariae (strain CBS 270.75 / DBVPG 7215 / KCTC 17166 / NRRL Y-17582) TaxID=931890 RepID=G8JVT5_ERECY|nr:hypothetical protein Ecym_7098 [Eremothecium cymbalariae DBVPG\
MVEAFTDFYRPNMFTDIDTGAITNGVSMPAAILMRKDSDDEDEDSGNSGTDVNDVFIEQGDGSVGGEGLFSELSNGRVGEQAEAVAVTDGEGGSEQLLPIIHNMDILSKLFESIAGKDKMFKILKYSLDLLRLYISRYRHNMIKSDPETLLRYAKSIASWNFWVMIRHPVTVVKLFLISTSKQFEKNSLVVCDTIATFRQVLRFGGTPFLLRTFYLKCKDTYLQIKKAPSREPYTVLRTINKIWSNESTLTDFLWLYFGIMDELSLTHKLGLWANKPLYEFVTRHEVLSWHYDIMLSLKKSWLQLQKLNAHKLDLEIQWKVRQRAWDMSQKLNSGRQFSQIKRQLLKDLQLNYPTTDTSLTSELEKINQDRHILYLDLVRLSFDFLANSTDVLNLSVPSGTYGWLSLGSGITGFFKLWLQAKKELQFNNKPF